MARMSILLRRQFAALAGASPCYKRHRSESGSCRDSASQAIETRYFNLYGTIDKTPRSQQSITGCLQSCIVGADAQWVDPEFQKA